MPENKKLFLETKLSQIETTKILVKKLEPTIEYLSYNIKRYKIPVTMILFYTQEDISKQLKESTRLTDVIITIKLGVSYFNFIFLPFTDEINSYTFIKHIQKIQLNNIKSFFYFEELKPTIHNYYNFINSYLFEIEKKETFF